MTITPFLHYFAININRANLIIRIIQSIIVLFIGQYMNLIICHLKCVRYYEWGPIIIYLKHITNIIFGTVISLAKVTYNDSECYGVITQSKTILFKIILNHGICTKYIVTNAFATISALNNQFRVKLIFSPNSRTSIAKWAHIIVSFQLGISIYNSLNLLRKRLLRFPLRAPSSWGLCSFYIKRLFFFHF